MKRPILPALALLLILSGCASQTEPTPTPTATQATEALAVTEPAGLYDAHSEQEQRTGGALKVYPLGRTDSIGIACMGNGILLFSGAETTTLTKLSGDDLYVSATTAINCGIYPSDAAVQVSESGITYYDERQNRLVFLDAQLQECGAVALPDAMIGAPALSEDLRQLYYCTADALRCMDLETGLDRLLKEMNFSDLTITALHCDDTVIACAAEDTDGNHSLLFISTETGQLLHEALDDVSLWTDGSLYFAARRDGIYQELLVGDSEQGPTLLAPRTYDPLVYSAVERGSTVLVSADENADNLQLDHYDLRSGKRTASLTLEGREPIYSLHGQAEKIWFLRYDPHYGCEVLHCWTPEKSAVSDAHSYFSARYTAENPDLVGIAACREIADAMSEKFGVQILLWTDATAFQPWDYTLVPEYQVSVIREELRELDEFLALYPAGFLKTAASSTRSGRIRICLVRGIYGNTSADGTLSEVVGLQYWDDNADAYLSLAAEQDRLMQNACHEIFHIIESRVMTACKAYDDWGKLNPKGFEYDYDYITNLARRDDQWIDGEGRAFIDRYAMSYPKEDRARIMEYAMLPGNEAYFQTDAMQAKLRQLCRGIREAFGLKKSEEVFVWEQYLEEPLSKK